MACSKIFSGDLPELINEIIQYFQNDTSTLHSCILVNRLWCRLAIPLLWEDPFSIPITKNYHFIEIYLHSLNESDKTKLNEYGIDSNLLFPSSTLFNYPSFIKCLNTYKIIYSIEKWVAIVRNLKTDVQPAIYNLLQNFKSSIKLIYKSLFKIFIENEVDLYTFEVILLASKDHDYFNNVCGLILQNTNFIRNIKNLKLVIFGRNVTLSKIDTFLSLLSSNCKSISTLHFQFNRNEEIFKNFSSHIIKTQQNLKTISFDSPLFHHLLLPLKNYNCSNTLKTVIFYHIDFKNILILKEVFEQLNVLESVHILYCISLNSVFIQQIINITKPFKLRSLFVSGGFQIESFQLLLQKSGDYLENIGFESFTSNEFKQKFLEQITKFCSKIKFFKLNGFDNRAIYPSFDLIKNIGQNLNYLTINFENYYYYFNHLNENHIKLSSTILQELGQILPFKLEYLNLTLIFNISDFELFLNNSQNTFIKKLLIKNKVKESEEILFYIKEYIMKNRRVKYLAFEDEKGRDLACLRDEVMEFKLYDIKIQNYNSLYIQVCDFIKEMY
ncbi:hypothetical protein C1645_881353 [Glomus cerebriforme]|uniref:F-box domain-containing protein n=1 Tax=Glomus cerebriforme TaxID=658196 RepID=A0A397S8R8_9GLOM|nr:hypothetical protein C1645_881353 [Glomus cerebriforme]